MKGKSTNLLSCIMMKGNRFFPHFRVHDPTFSSLETSEGEKTNAIEESILSLDLKVGDLESC